MVPVVPGAALLVTISQTEVPEENQQQGTSARAVVALGELVAPSLVILAVTAVQHRIQPPAVQVAQVGLLAPLVLMAPAVAEEEAVAPAVLQHPVVMVVPV